MTPGRFIVLSVASLALLNLVTLIVFSKLYYPALPFEGISKRDAVRLLGNSSGELVELYQGESYDWYGFKGSPLEGSQQLIQEMSRRDWTFTEQLGAGYIFQDSDSRIRIVESEKWTRKYIIFQIPES